MVAGSVGEATAAVNSFSLGGAAIMGDASAMVPQSSGNPTRRVVIVGASDRPERPACKALAMLRAQGFTVLPVHPRITAIEGIPVLRDLSEVSGDVDTVTLYVNPAIGGTLAEALLALRPRRVIFNPGSECPALAGRLAAAGIASVEACTLVLLATGAF